MFLVSKHLQQSQFGIKFLSWNRLPCEMKFDLLTVVYIVQCTCIPQSTTVFVPSLELGPPHPHSSVSSPPPPGTKRGDGTHSPAGEGVGEVQFGLLERKLSTLSTL
jgi:hypothetical protein